MGPACRAPSAGLTIPACASRCCCAGRAASPLDDRLRAGSADGSRRHDAGRRRSGGSRAYACPAVVRRAGQSDREPRRYIFGHRDRMDEQEDTIRTVCDGRLRYIRNYHPDRPWMQHHEYADQFATWKELRRLRFEEAVTGSRRSAEPADARAAQRGGQQQPQEELYDHCQRSVSRSKTLRPTRAMLKIWSACAASSTLAAGVWRPRPDPRS